MNNLILIGMPGTGKTTFGNTLAKKLGREFRDSDDDIGLYTGEDVSKHLERLGDEAFLVFEAEEVKKYYADLHNSVLSTGGSVALVDETLAFLKQRGKIILLDTPIDDIIARSGNMRLDRIVGMNGNPPQFNNLRDLFEFRKEKYRQAADRIIRLHGRTQEEIADLILV